MLTSQIVCFGTLLTACLMTTCAASTDVSLPSTDRHDHPHESSTSRTSDESSLTDISEEDERVSRETLEFIVSAVEGIHSDEDGNINISTGSEEDQGRISLCTTGNIKKCLSYACKLCKIKPKPTCLKHLCFSIKLPCFSLNWIPDFLG